MKSEASGCPEARELAFYSALNERPSSGRLVFGAYLGVPPKRGFRLAAAFSV